MPTNHAITRHDDASERDGDPWVHGPPPIEPVTIVDWDPSWPGWFDDLQQRIRAALGERVVSLEHVGSTSVVGLAAKPIIDIDLTVRDSSAEADYVPALEAIGFVHTIREDWWHEHRMLVSAGPRSNLHVWSPDSPEATRHLLFRDWLCDHPDDRAAYERAKRSAARDTNRVGEDGMAYNRRKQPVIREILDRVFCAHGLL